MKTEECMRLVLGFEASQRSSSPRERRRRAEEEEALCGLSAL